MMILGEMFMCRSQNRDMRGVSSLALCDLDARLAPLDRYGLAGFSSALVDGLRALFGASRNAIVGASLTDEHCGREC